MLASNASHGRPIPPLPLPLTLALALVHALTLTLTRYVPACAYAIHAHNAQQPPSRRINLQGISIGDGAFAPEVQLREQRESMPFMLSTPPPPPPYPSFSGAAVGRLR